MKILHVFVATLALAALCAGCSGGGADALTREGIKCFERGDYDCAIEKYSAALKESETSAGWNLLGMAYRFKYNSTALSEWKEKEIEAFDKAIEMDPKNVAAVKNLGATLYYIGEKQRAADLFRRALELNPYDPEKEQLEKMIREAE